MKKVRETHIWWFIIFLMIIRVFLNGKWMACVGMGGLMIAIYDVLSKFCHINEDIVSDNMKIRYAIVFISCNLMFFVIGCLLILNMLADIPCLYDVLFVDEMTLVTLLLTITQEKVINELNEFIGR